MQNSLENSISSLNQTASLLLAAAVIDLFPDVLIVGGEGTLKYFYQDFIFPFEFTSEILPIIEERMRLIIREKRSVRTFEMVPSNAAALMQHHQQKMLAHQLMQIQQATVQMAQVGNNVIGFCPYPPLKTLSIPFFKILESYSLESSETKTLRIIGAASFDKEILKEISKQPAISSLSHLKIASESNLLKPMKEEGMWYWCPRGEWIREQLIQWWRRECVKKNFNLISSPISFLGEGREKNILHSHREYYLKFGTAKISEIRWIRNGDFISLNFGLFSPKVFFADRMHVFCSNDEKLLEECISSLPFILKIPKILGFEFEIVLSVSSKGVQKTKAKGAAIFQQALEKAGFDYIIEKEYRVGVLASIDIRLSDSLGRRWTGPFLSMPDVAMSERQGSVLTISAFGSLERICALLLEKTGGWLPLWLAPEQVRILVANDKIGSYAIEVYKTLNAQGIRVSVENGEEALKTRLYRAIVERVPYVLLLGEREKKEKFLSIRAYGERKEQILSLDELCMRLKKEMESGNSELKN